MRRLLPFALLLIASPALAEDKPAPLTGTWVREIGGSTRLSLRFTEKRLYFVGETAYEQAGTLRFAFDADYAVNPESAVFGIVTGADVSLGETTQEVQSQLDQNRDKIVDTPFSFRIRLDGDTLSAKQLHGLGVGGEDGTPNQPTIQGQYRRVEKLSAFEPTTKRKPVVRKESPILPWVTERLREKYPNDGDVTYPQRYNAEAKAARITEFAPPPEPTPIPEKK